MYLVAFLLLQCDLAKAQIFGGFGGGRPQGILNPNRGGILRDGFDAADHDGGDGGGGILGGAGAGPGGRAGILAAMERAEQQQQGQPPHQRPRSKEDWDRVRVGPIILNKDHLAYDDLDEYGDEEDDEEPMNSRPHLGFDLGNIFVPLANFLKFTGKGFSSLFWMLERQANLLLGRGDHPQGHMSTTIVIIISWLVVAIVIYALAQVVTLRRLTEEEEAFEEQRALLANQGLSAAPSVHTTPPTPGVDVPPTANNNTGKSNGHVINKSNKNNLAGNSKPLWLPSVGALQLSKSSILKRRESVKRRRKFKATDRKQRMSTVRTSGHEVKPETVDWVEAGLGRLQADDNVRENVLLKWKEFLIQHVMQPIQKVTSCTSGLANFSSF